MKGAVTNMRKVKCRLINKLPLMLACAGLLSQPLIASAEDVKPENASYNRVEINDGEYSINDETKTTADDYDRVYGGGSEDNKETSVDNRVEINGGTIHSGVIGGISMTGNVGGNRIVINGGEVFNADGGLTYFSYGDDYTPGSVLNNEVLVRGGLVHNAIGGEVGFSYDVENPPSSSVYFEQSPLVSGNRVRIEADGRITGIAVGGIAYTGRVQNNAVDIDGGTISGEVIGGWLRNPGGDDYSVTDNEININGAADLIDAYLIGGLVGTSDGRYYSPGGNTLNINTSGITARSINGFENINFNLSSDVRSGETMLTLTEGRTELGGTYLTIRADGDSGLTTNDRVSLIKNTDGGIGIDSSTATSAGIDEGDKMIGDVRYSGTMNKGATFDYDVAMQLADDGQSFDVVVGEQHLLEESVMPPDPVPIPIMKDPIKINIDSDRDMFEDTKVTDIAQIHDARGFEMFGNLGGGHFKIKTGGGSYIKTDMQTYDIGFARNFVRDNSVITLAPVVEYGYGKYDSHLASGIDGSGNQKYFAGGVVFRSVNNSGFYYETSFRGGQTRTSYSSSHFWRGNERVHTSYNVKAPTMTGHVRLGNQYRMGRNHVLDVYGIYNYARQNSSDTDLNLGDHYEFSGINSHRLRAGYRLTSRLSDVSQIYTGLAYQYDNSSDSVARCEDVEAVSVGQSGSSGMLEIGWLVKPFKNNPWMLDIHTTGWVGMQEGFTAMAKVKRSF